MKRVRQFFGFLFFRVFPILLILGIAYFGLQVIQSLVRVSNEGALYQSRLPLYAQTATAMNGESQLIRVMFRQVFATATPRANPSFATATPLTTHTPEAAIGQATITLPPVGTPFQVPTVLLPESAAEGLSFGGTAIPTAVTPIDRQGKDLVNILLLGQDNEITGDSLARTDTMIVVSINRGTGTVSMLSLPRDMYVYMVNGTMGRLNTVYAIGDAIGWTGGGFFFMRQTLLYNFGINVHFYALVDISGFTEAIDILGTVDVAVDCAITDLPLIGAELPRGVIESETEEGFYTLPVGYYQMTGPEALWYARSRHSGTDFDRGRRQQQLLRAAWRKARDTGILTSLPSLWSEATQIVETNLGFNEMVSLLPIALNLNSNLIENYTMIRTYHTEPWQTPDGDFVQIPYPEPVRQLMEDFYTPPTENQVAIDAAQIRVLNGTTQLNWDLVAADRLGYSSFNAIAAGPADNLEYPSTILIDYTGQSKGSSLNEIARILNVRPENIRVQPDPNRTVDFEVILGTDYNSCTFAGR
ncbi:MAG: LCP family protein [Anaerolineae bacterium]|jgi:LCP family protein required for cell wall assembly|nr:LCP family protein [Anaerolineae bacterium]